MVPFSIRLVARLGVAGLALATMLGSQSRFDGAVSSDEAAPFVPDAQAARFASLGFEGLVGDLFWLRAIQVIGNDERGVVRDLPRISRLTDLVVALDPWVDHPYRFAAVWVSEDPDEVRTANRMLERGISYHPRDWRNRFYLSFNHFFYLGDNAAAARELARAVALPGAPVYLSRLLARLQSSAHEDGLETAAVYLEELLRATDDPWKRVEFEKALDEIECERRARVLDAAREVYRERNGRDIARVEDLVRGSGAVLPRLPEELHGWEWEIDPKTGSIVSSFYRRRYQVNFQDGRHLTQRTAGGKTR